MASFPTSVKSFTSKNSGDVVQAAHVNDLQDEVNAMEDGYINGTAPLNSSNSTVANLQVTGASTMGALGITGTLQVNGASTLGVVGLTGTLQVNGGSTLSGGLQTAASTFSVRPVTPPPSAVQVFLDSTVTLGSSAASTIAWLAQGFAINSSLHSTGANPARLTPDSTGIWQFFAQLAFSPEPSGDRTVIIRDSSAVNIALSRTNASTGAAQGTHVNATGLKRFDALGGYAVCEAHQTGPSTMSLSTGVGLTWFSMVKL